MKDQHLQTLIARANKVAEAQEVLLAEADGKVERQLDIYETQQAINKLNKAH